MNGWRRIHPQTPGNLSIGTNCYSEQNPEPEFVKLLRRPGIDSQTCGPVRQPYLMYRPPPQNFPAFSLFKIFLSNVPHSGRGLVCRIKPWCFFPRIHLIQIMEHIPSGVFPSKTPACHSQLRFLKSYGLPAPDT